MIELPETYVLSEQISQTLVGKTVMNVMANVHPHGFAWFTGNPDEYHSKLSGKTITASNPGTGYTCGGNTEITCGDILLVLSTPVKFLAADEKLPAKHQLLIEFEDHSHMSCTVQMWGAMFCYPAGENGLPDAFVCNKCPSPLTDAFDEDYFEGLWQNTKPSLSAKAFLATEQRIPGLGNGVLQDILYNAKIHPRRRLESITATEKANLFGSVKQTLFEMTAGGGRDTERDLFGCPGGYKTKLSAKTKGKPCQTCGSEIIREAFLGGNIYYCPKCQRFEKK